MRYVAPGTDSSEYRKALRAEIAGFIVLALALVICGVAVFSADADTGVVGIGLALAGAHMVAHTSHGYSLARGAVKASAAHPPQGSRGI